VLGAIASGFGLIALLGAETMWQVLSLSLVALALLAVVVDGGWRTPGRAAGSLVASAAAIALAFMPGPTVASRHLSIGAGRTKLARTPADIHDILTEERAHVFWSRDGIESGIALTARSSLSLIVNGKSDGAARLDAATMIMAPLLGSLLAERPERGLIIGLGTGESAGWLAEVDTIEHVDCIELEPGVVEVARILAPHNFDVVNHPKVTIHVGDGREFVLASKDTYDVIMSEPSNPYRAGVASLFSQDFYRSVMDRLDDDGVFVQWLQAYEVDARTVRAQAAARPRRGRDEDPARAAPL
jgi:spermidine synthase